MQNLSMYCKNEINIIRGITTKVGSFVKAKVGKVWIKNGMNMKFTFLQIRKISLIRKNILQCPIVVKICTKSKFSCIYIFALI